MRKNILSSFLAALIAAMLVLTGGCGGSDSSYSSYDSSSYTSSAETALRERADSDVSDTDIHSSEHESENDSAGAGSGDVSDDSPSSKAAAETDAAYGEDKFTSPGEEISDADSLADSSDENERAVSEIPDYSGEPYAAVNDNEPFFKDSELTTKAFESYSELDNLGRCGTAYADVCEETMPTKKRGDIGSVKPTGWHTVKYNDVDGKYLYNRCHLIGYQLTGENANPENLITGTRYLNTEGMLPFENMIADYVKETGGHVLYRVTPIFNGDDLLARGVLMEAESVEDEGESILFNVFCYNIQPGIAVDYETGDSIELDEVGSYDGKTNHSSYGNDSSGQFSIADGSTSGDDNNVSETTGSISENEASSQNENSGSMTPSEVMYIGNKNTKKFHLPSCSSVKQMKDENKEDLYSREQAINEGYSPCKNCNP